MDGDASDMPASEDGDDDNSVLNIIGAIVFSTLLVCVLAIFTCHFWRRAKARKLQVVKPVDDSLCMRTPCAYKASCSKPHSGDTTMVTVEGRMVEGRNTIKHHPEGLPPLKVKSCEFHDEVLQDVSLDEDVTLGNWVGSAEWIASHALRKKRVSEILHRSVVVGQACDTKPLEEKVPPKAPLVAPPELEILLPGANSIEKDDTQKVALANAMVHEQLQNTAATDIELRKKTFKTLCAKWHPDKNQPGQVDFTTEVFQYLQAQKAWYLD